MFKLLECCAETSLQLYQVQNLVAIPGRGVFLIAPVPTPLESALPVGATGDGLRLLPPVNELSFPIPHLL